MTRFTTRVYTISNLIFFSYLGTLARLGLQSLTTYPGAPVAGTGVLWANFTGCFIMGFVGELRGLLEIDSSSSSSSTSAETQAEEDGGVSNGNPQEEEEGGQLPIQLEVSTGDRAAAQPPRLQDSTNARRKKKRKQTTTTTPPPPLYIGLTTGLCGCMTSFSSFTRDLFLALSSSPLPSSSSSSSPPKAAPPSAGHALLSTLALTILTLSLSLSALQSGTHLGSLLLPYTRKPPPLFVTCTTPLLLLLLTLSSYPTILTLLLVTNHHTYQTSTSTLYALLFAPPACLARYYLSRRLNPVFPGFPLGTFAVNVSGTLILGAAWDVQHRTERMVSCRVLQGVMDGGCGCLTTVSTWVVEIRGLAGAGAGAGKEGRGWGWGKAYGYALASVVAGLVALVAVVGGVKWSGGLGGRVC
ncbi:MAG: hypothetical protein M1816_007146 [Peltula sp. TS41687]|nr:MAG: hypothetical protein M1816_007146 [Peltula sp. TS41687]